MTTEEALGRLFHEEYEAVAVEQGWKTQESCRSKDFDALPQANRNTMIETCRRVLARLRELPGAQVVTLSRREKLVTVGCGVLMVRTGNWEAPGPGKFLIIPVEKKP